MRIAKKGHMDGMGVEWWVPWVDVMQSSDRMEEKYLAVVAERDKLEAALRTVLPLAKSWVAKEYAYSCDHDAGECYCDQEARDKAAIAAAVAALGVDP